jgi:hypothetical protein
MTRWPKTSRRRNISFFGSDGFEVMAKRFASLEQQFGIGDLEQFTPR